MGGWHIVPNDSTVASATSSVESDLGVFGDTAVRVYGAVAVAVIVGVTVAVEVAVNVGGGVLVIDGEIEGVTGGEMVTGAHPTRIITNMIV